MTSEKTPPFTVNFDLSRLPEGETEITLAPTAEQRAALAHWAGVGSLETLKGAVVLKKLGAGHFHYEARFTADVVQSCVVTLEPVRSHIAREFTRLYQIPEGVRHAPAKRAIQLTSHVEDDEPEMLESFVLDIALPVLEELSLAIDPYPRKPGVAFQPPADALGKAENPFAVLKTLRTKR